MKIISTCLTVLAVVVTGAYVKYGHVSSSTQKSPIASSEALRFNATSVNVKPLEFNVEFSPAKAGEILTTVMVKTKKANSKGTEKLRAIFAGKIRGYREHCFKSQGDGITFVQVPVNEVDDFIAELKRSESVEFAEKDVQGESRDALLQIFPDDPYFASANFILVPYVSGSTYGVYYTSAEQHSLWNRGSNAVLYTANSLPQSEFYTESGAFRADVSAPEGWAIRHDASNIIVAVIDSGLDYRHPDLTSNLWTNIGGGGTIRLM